MQYNKSAAGLNVIVYGFSRENSFAYPAGFKMELIGPEGKQAYSCNVIMHKT